MDAIKWVSCVGCKTKVLDISTEGICTYCKKDKEDRSEVLMFSETNKMDPGEVPVELCRLTDLEKILIARVHPVMVVM